MTRGGGLREDVRGIASVALATQFFRICFIFHLDFWPSGHPDFWPSDLTVMTIRLSDHLVIRPSGHPTIRSFGLLVFWPSVPMPQKCPYWDIFGLPYCRLHQSQIPNVLPAGGATGDLFELILVK